MDVRFNVAGKRGEFFVRGNLLFGARASSVFRRSRYCGASKITPNESDALLEPFVAVLQVFEDHALC